MLSGIRGARLTVVRVQAKCKDDDHNSVDRERVLNRLQPRDHGLDSGAATQQRRRLDEVGDWKARRAEQHRP